MSAPSELIDVVAEAMYERYHAGLERHQAPAWSGTHPLTRTLWRDLATIALDRAEKSAP